MFNDSKVWYFLPYLIVISVFVLIAFIAGLSNGVHDTSVTYPNVVDTGFISNLVVDTGFISNSVPTYPTEEIHTIVILQHYMAGNTPVIQYSDFSGHGVDSKPRYYVAENKDKVYTMIEVNKSYSVQMYMDNSDDALSNNPNGIIFHNINGVEI